MIELHEEHNEKTITVLIAEDSKIISDNIKAVLSFEKNIEVVGQVKSGKDAVNFVRKRRPAVILMDIEMDARRDGIDAVAEIMDLYPQAKIVMLTVQEDENSILSSFEAGACDYVLKSASAKVIIDAIDAAYNDCSPIRPIIASKIRKQLKHVKKLKDNMYYVINVITKLTPTEKAILIDFLDGKKQKEIAKLRYIELNTVKTHVKNLLKKFQARRMSDVIDILKKNDIDKIIRMQ